MLTIQQAGAEILGGNPGRFYVFVGTEYGVKRKYIEHLMEYYKNYITADTVSEVLESMQRKSIIPVPPKLYIVRYDETYLSALNDKSAARIAKIKINGTIICLYETEQSYVRCAKYLPDYTVPFDGVHPEFIKKYLHSDFPQLSESLIAEAVKMRSDYMGAYNICINLVTLSDMEQSSISVKEIEDTFGYSLNSEDRLIKEAFAAKDIRLCIDLIDNYSNDFDMVFYVLLSVLTDLEKLLINPKQKSDYKRYIKAWTIENVCNMFSHVYAELERSRELQGYNAHDRLVYLILLLQYNPIPHVGVMNSGV